MDISCFLTILNREPVPLSVLGGNQFQLVTFCNRLITLLLQTEFQHFPIILGQVIVWLLGQNTAHIHDGEVPFLLFIILYGTNFLFFKQLYLMLLCHAFIL